MAERTLQLLPAADAPRQARAFVRGRLRGVLDGDALEDTLLLASELVVTRLGTDGPDPDRRISVVLRFDDDVVVCRVSDTGRAPGVEEPWWPSDGHGADRLRLLDVLSADWGVEEGPPLGVWFTVRPAPAGAAA
jgi:hypothetical protein